jgi:hypothetical protein
MRANWHDFNPVFPACATRKSVSGGLSVSESNSLKLAIKILLDDLPELAVRPMSCK